MNDAVGARLKFREDFQESARNRLQRLSSSFTGLAKGFEDTSVRKNELEPEEEERIVEKLWRNVCSSCTECRNCWEKDEEATYRRLSLLIRREMLDNEKEKMTIDEKNDCSGNERLGIELKSELMNIRRQLGWYNRMAESREAVAGQLREVGRILEEFSEELYRPGEIMELKKHIIVFSLRLLGVRAKNIYMFRRPDRGIELHMRAKSIRNGSITAKEAAAAASRAIDLRLVARADSSHIIGGTYRSFCFCEDVNYQVISGVARLAKPEEKVSGDNFSFLDPENGSILMILSDGMGSGLIADKESTFVIELLEQLLAAGFHEESAIRLLNSVLILKNEHTVLSTVDISVINLYTGTCEFIKFGAAITYIRRENRVECISGEGLPLGVVTDTDSSRSRCKLFSGDYVVMVSDGVAECLGGRDSVATLKEIISDAKGTNPQELADEIMNCVCRRNQGRRNDDMTILVSGVWKKPLNYV